MRRPRQPAPTWAPRQPSPRAASFQPEPVGSLRMDVGGLQGSETADSGGLCRLATHTGLVCMHTLTHWPRHPAVLSQGGGWGGSSHHTETPPHTPPPATPPSSGHSLPGPLPCSLCHTLQAWFCWGDSQARCSGARQSGAVDHTGTWVSGPCGKAAGMGYSMHPAAPQLLPSCTPAAVMLMRAWEPGQLIESYRIMGWPGHLLPCQFTPPAPACDPPAAALSGPASGWPQCWASREVPAAAVAWCASLLGPFLQAISANMS